MKPRFSTTLLACVAVLTLSTASAGQTMDDAAIREVQASQADAWNRHDATAYSNLFTEDGEVVNVVGWWWKGRSQSGAKTPPGIPEPREGIQIEVLKKVDGKWLIYSFQNTNSVPERPFPKGPPSAGPK